MQFEIVRWLIMSYDLKWCDPQEEGGVQKGVFWKISLADQVFCNTNHALQAY